MNEPATVEQLRDAVTASARVVVRGGGTKPALCAEPTLSTCRLTGVLSYDPGEFTFTARAGTPLREIREMLAEQGQFLAFDPPWVAAGSTLGGATAAGISGPGRLRFGGLRDFLLGARLVTGEGRIVFGGGKVVKNAAGFDIPKLMVGACGEYGVLAELTFKVFPRPEAYATVEATCRSFQAALQLQSRVASSPLEPAAVDLAPPRRLLVRVGGLRAAQAMRIDRLRTLCAGEASLRVLEHDDDERVWTEARELSWAEDLPLLARAAIAPTDIPQLERCFADSDGIRRCYSVAGNVLWLAGPESAAAQACERLSDRLGPVITVVRGQPAPRPTADAENGFRQRLRAVFDPQQKLHAAASAD